MIITDIAQIDRLAGRLLNDNSGFKSLDPTDREYAFIKKHSDCLKAVKMDGDDISESLGTALLDELMQADPERMQTILLHIGTSGEIAFEQLDHLLETLHNALERVNLIWETASDGREGGVALFAVIGYKANKSI